MDKLKISRSKLFVLREKLQVVESLIYYKSKEQLALIFMKLLLANKFELLREKLGVRFSYYTVC